MASRGLPLPKRWPLIEVGRRIIDSFDLQPPIELALVLF